MSFDDPDELEERRKLHESHFPLYVTMTDTFLTGWGKARGRIAKYVMGANTLEEAQIIIQNAEDRGDQKNIRLRQTRPTYPILTHRIGFMDRESAKAWLEPNSFRNRQRTYSRNAD